MNVLSLTKEDLFQFLPGFMTKNLTGREKELDIFYQEYHPTFVCLFVFNFCNYSNLFVHVEILGHKHLSSAIHNSQFVAL